MTRLINKQTLTATVVGVAVTLFGMVAVNVCSRISLAQAMSVSETRIIQPDELSAADVPLHACPSTANAPTASAPAAFEWQAPDGWKDAGSKGIRVANFTAGPAGEAECYVTLLGGTGGGVAMNVNRWRAQLGLPEAAVQEIEALPSIKMLGINAVLVDVEGTYGQGDGVHAGTEGVHAGAGAESPDAYRLLGAIALRPAGAVFVKMTGPAGVVAAERDKFIAFAESLREAAPSPTDAAGEHACCEKGHQA